MIISKEKAKRIVERLKGKQLTHAKFGECTVIKVNPENLTFDVRFENKVMKFAYPSSFTPRCLMGNVEVHLVEEKKSETNGKKENNFQFEPKKIKHTYGKYTPWEFATKYPYQGGSCTGK